MHIPVIKGRGVDPHMTFCPRCGGEGNGIVLAPIKAKLSNGAWIYATAGQGSKARMDAEKRGLSVVSSWERLEEHERVPDCEPCDKCKAEMNEHMEIVKAGGVYFRCKKCHQEGVIKAESPFSALVRQASGIAAPDPVGIEFDTCDQHSGGSK